MPVRPRTAVPVLAALAAVLTACGSPGVTPAAAPSTTVAPATTTPAPTTPPTTTTPAPPPGPPTCDVTLTRNGSDVSGSGAVQITDGDDGLELNCDNGPTVAIRFQPGRAAVFRFQGRRTTIPAGRTMRVGPYAVQVLSVTNDRATMRITRPGP